MMILPITDLQKPSHENRDDHKEQLKCHQNLEILHFNIILSIPTSPESSFIKYLSTTYYPGTLLLGKEMTRISPPLRLARLNAQPGKLPT